MKKTALSACVFAVLFFLFAPAVFAETEPDGTFQAAFDAVDEETARLLSSLGIDPQNSLSVFSVGAADVLRCVKDVFSVNVPRVLSGVPLFVFGEFVLGLSLPFLKGKTRELLSRAGGAILLFTVLPAGVDVVSAAASAVRLTGTMSLSLIPIPVAVAAVRGRTVGLGVQTGVLAFAETAGFAVSEALLPLCGVGTALGAAAVISPCPGPAKAGETLFRALSWLLGAVAALFSAVLGLKGILAAGADRLTLRGAKILLGGTVPIVGSAVGDALASLSGALAASQGSAAVLGFVTAALVNLPALSALLAARAGLFVMDLSADLFALPPVAEGVRVLTSLIRLLLAAVLFNAVVYLIALGILASAG